MNESPNWIAWLLLGILALIWGSSFILIKTGLQAFSAGEVGAMRIAFASVFLLPVSLPRLRLIQRRQWVLLAVVGLFGSLIPSFLFAAAQTEINSSIAGILNALTPLFTLIIGMLFFTQRASRDTLLGILIGFAGSVVLIASGSEDGLQGVNWYGLLVVCATIFYGANLNLIKFRITELNSRTITSVSLLIVGPAAVAYLLFFTPFVSHIQDPATHVSLMAVAALGIVGTAIALILFNQLVKITSPVFTSSVTYLIPIVAVFWGLIDGEQLTAGHYLGLGLIIGGVYLSTYRQRRQAKKLAGKIPAGK